MANSIPQELVDKLIFFFPNGFKGIAKLKGLHVKRQDFIAKDLKLIRKSYEAAALSIVTPLDLIVQCKDEVSEYFVPFNKLLDIEAGWWVKLRSAFEAGDDDKINRILAVITETMDEELALLPATLDEKGIRAYLEKAAKQSRSQMAKLGK
jgi:hypothetical protein